MSNSTFATKYIEASSRNYYGKRTAPIDKIIVHHMAAKWTAERCAESFTNPNRGASATYCIGYNGEIVRCLDESIAPGTSSSRVADNTAVTIEVANSESGGQWRVSDAALESLIKLCADIAKRNGLGNLVKGKNLCWHSMYAATACPGPYLLSKMDYIASRVNSINSTNNGYIAGYDSYRQADELIVYTKGIYNNGKTGTNKWGYEVRVDKYGIALEDPHYSGNTAIPSGGKVISGHGKAGDWIYNNIKKGYAVWIENNIVCVSKLPHRLVDAVNGRRYTNYLVVYNTGSSTGTNKWGYEVAIDKYGKAGAPIYGVGNMKIPEGGFVVSGHDKGGDWIAANIREGCTVTFDGSKLIVNY